MGLKLKCHFPSKDNRRRFRTQKIRTELCYKDSCKLACFTKKESVNIADKTKHTNLNDLSYNHLRSEIAHFSQV